MAPKEEKKRRGVSLAVSSETAAAGGVVEGNFSSLAASLRFESGKAETAHVRYSLEVQETPFRFAVGVYDASRRRVVLKEADVFALRIEPKREVVAVEKMEDTLENRLKLAELYGSKKKQKILRAQLANKVEVDASMAAALESTLEALKADDREMTTARRVSASNAPARNASAATAEEMYDWNALFALDDDVLRNQLDALETFRDAASSWPAFAKGKLETSEHKTSVVLLRHMMVFLDVKDKGVLRVAEYAREHHIPEKIVNRFLDAYAQRTSDDERAVKYSRPKVLRNKLTMHLLLLALRVSNFTLDTAELADALRLTPAALSPFLKELGCAVTKNKATLAPTSSDKPRPGAKKRRLSSAPPS